MFGFIFGAAKIDAYRADVIHTYLGTFHRVHETLGSDSLIRTIQTNPNIVFQDQGQFKAFRVPGDLDDFEFILPNLINVPSAQPLVAVHGRTTYRGFQVNVSLTKGTYMLFMKEPTRRASNLCQLFQTKYDASRVT
jgi:hypothetical protein